MPSTTREVSVVTSDSEVYHAVVFGHPSWPHECALSEPLQGKAAETIVKTAEIVVITQSVLVRPPCIYTQRQTRAGASFRQLGCRSLAAVTRGRTRLPQQDRPYQSRRPKPEPSQARPFAVSMVEISPQTGRTHQHEP